MSKTAKYLIILLALFTAILLLLGLKSNLLSMVDCQIKGGSWSEGITGKFRGWEVVTGEYCIYPAGDWGRKCFQDSECERDCIYKGSGEDAYLYGECSKRLIICDESTIPFKTQNSSDLDKNQCYSD